MNQTVLRPEDILVRTQSTPNPYALKFIANMPFKEGGKATFAAPIEAEGLPLIYDLFLIDGVRQIHVFENTCTITHTGELEEQDLIAQAESVIKSRGPVHNSRFELGEKENVRPMRDRSDLSPELLQIEEILDRTIRPGLQADGGDIEVVGFEDNQLQIIYQGACGGCPSSMMGTLDAIQSILRHELQDDKIRVIPV